MTDTLKASGSHPENHPLWAPGLKWRERTGRKVPYWIPPAKDIQAGYRPKNLALDPAADQLELAARCRHQWTDLNAWRNRETADKPTNYSFAWLIDRYENDEHSPFQRVKGKTQDDYRGMNRIIRKAIGERRIDPRREGGVLVPRVLGEDLRRWHANWGRPVPLVDEAGAPVLDTRGKPVMVASMPARQRAAITQVRMLVKYGKTIGCPGAKDLADMLHDMRFPTPEGRNEAPTPAQVADIVKEAKKAGDLSVAITTLAQFELTERRIHIIGEWEGKAPNQTWRGGWTWANYKAGVITYWQNKRKPVERIFDLKAVPDLFEMVESIPASQRFGAIIKDEKRGKPWQRYDFAKRFREIATAAKVPQNVWSMDMRAGGMTEADGIEMPDRWLQDAAGHKDPRTKDRYRRQKQRNAQNVVALRQAARGKSGEK